eukprot:7892554-Pyramimonas_sp.AAC.1
MQLATPPVPSAVSAFHIGDFICDSMCLSISCVGACIARTGAWGNLVASMMPGVMAGAFASLQRL